jgi:hypothetical protein
MLIRDSAGPERAAIDELPDMRDDGRCAVRRVMPLLDHIHKWTDQSAIHARITNVLPSIDDFIAKWTSQLYSVANNWIDLYFMV